MEITWNSPAQEGEMQAAFAAQVAQLHRELLEGQHQAESGASLGLESELQVDGENATEVRDALIDHDGADCELGRRQIELQSGPHKAAGTSVDALLASYRADWQRIQTAAENRGAHLLRIGFHPFIEVPGAERCTRRPHYIAAPDYYAAHAASCHPETLFGGGEVQARVHGARCPGLSQAMHPNWQVGSVTEGIVCVNASFHVSSRLLALTGSSRYICGNGSGMVVDTLHNDFRTTLWRMNFDDHAPGRKRPGVRVGLPDGYFRTFDAYVKRMGQFPFLVHNAERAFAIAAGMNWLLARLNLREGKPVVELRSLPTQPRIEDEAALALFWIGWLFWVLQQKRFILSPFAHVQADCTMAERHGLSGLYWADPSGNGSYLRVNGPAAVRIELRRAVVGLEALGIRAAAEFVSDFVARRLESGSPADQLARLLGHRPEVEPDEMREAMTVLGMIA